MGRKAMVYHDLKVFLIFIAGVSLILTTGCLGLFENDDDNDRIPQIESMPEIFVARGLIDDMGNISTVYLDVDLYGNDPVDMRHIVMHLMATPKNGITVTCDLTYPQAGPIDDESYGIHEVDDPENTWDPDGTPPRYILGDGCILELEVNLTAVAVTLPPESTLEVFLHLTTSGHDTYDYFRTPANYPDNGTVRLED